MLTHGTYAKPATPGNLKHAPGSWPSYVPLSVHPYFGFLTFLFPNRSPGVAPVLHPCVESCYTYSLAGTPRRIPLLSLPPSWVPFFEQSNRGAGG